MQVGHHPLMLTLHAILNASNLILYVIFKVINPLLEILKLRSEPSLILVHPILHRVKLCVSDHCKLLHVSANRANLG